MCRTVEDFINDNGDSCMLASRCELHASAIICESAEDAGIS